MSMTKQHLTPKQKDVLEFITRSSEENGYSPSQTEIARHFGFKSLGTVQNYLVRLERLGLLRKTLGAHRGLQTNDAASPNHTDAASERSESVPLPLLGRVAAGRPIEAIPNQDTFDVPVSMMGNRAGGPTQHFVLKVAGDSMIEDGILDGDFVVIHKQPQARNGQTVVARIGNETTLKRFFKTAAQVELQPANRAYTPIIVSSLTSSEVDQVDFQIEGVLVGLIRRID